MKYKKYINLTFLIILLIVIFLFSNQTSVDSNNLSYSFLSKLLNTNIGSFINLIGRKCAHFIEYFALGILMYNTLKEFKIKNKLYSILLSMLCSILDEFHQLFIPGRTCTIKDFIIDSSGILLGITIIILKEKLWKKKIN